MSLIEGVGDEVTLILAGCLLCMVLMLAWFSTHTADIPLLREVGVIVVELSQRRNRTRVNQDEATERSGPEGQDSSAQQESPTEETISTRERSGEVLSSSISATESALNRPTESVASISGAASSEPRAAEQEVTGSLPQAAERLVADFDAAENETEKREEVDLESQGDTDSLVPPASVTVGLNESGGQALYAESDSLLSEEEVRRRRVQYFQSQPSPLACSTAESLPVPNEDASDLTAEASARLSSEANVLDSEEGTQQSSEDTLPDAFQESLLSSSHDGDESSRIRVKLKYMNETQRLVYASPLDTIGDFRRTHFQSELDDNKWVRFIYNGQDLRDDARTLRACNIGDNSTMHCLITAQARARPAHTGAQEDDDDTFFGAMMYPMFTLLLVIVWYLRFTYRQYFSAMSTVCLVGISFLLCLSYVSSFRGNAAQRQDTQTPAGGATAGGPTQNHPHSD